MKNVIKQWLFGEELKKIQALEAEKASIEAERVRLEEENSALKTPTKSEKELATEEGKPYINVVKVDYDPNAPGDGAFELDWNVFFISMLRQNGFVGDNDAAVVDQWFSQVCKNIGLEIYEQMIADPAKRSMIERRDLGDGKAEYF